MKPFDVMVTIFDAEGFACCRRGFSVHTDEHLKIVEAISDVLHIRFDNVNKEVNKDVHASNGKEDGTW